MIRYSVQPKNGIFVKGYGFLSFARYMGKNVGKNISRNLCRKYSPKPIYYAKESALKVPLKLLQQERFKKQQK